MRTFLCAVLLTICASLAASAQEPLVVSTGFPDAPSALASIARTWTDEASPEPPTALLTLDESFGSLRPTRQLMPMYFIAPRVTAPPPRTFQWREASNQALMFLSAQHGLRLLQPKTRRELGGSFWADYAASVKGIRGWGDGDGPFTNYVLHPGEGGVASFIFIQNSPSARLREFDAADPAYWRSRLKAMAFAAAFSTQFEIGLYSEAALGNVGQRPGTSGYVDLVMTPVGGFAFTVIEDAVDRKVIRSLERNRSSLARKRLYRVVLNPERSIANVLRFKVPWHRDTRPMPLE